MTERKKIKKLAILCAKAGVKQPWRAARQFYSVSGSRLEFLEMIEKAPRCYIYSEIIQSEYTSFCAIHYITFPDGTVLEFCCP